MGNITVKTKARIQLGIILALVIAVVSLLLSQNANPNMPLLFNIKRVQEKAYLKFKTNPVDRVDYLSIILDKRLKELQSVVNSKDNSYVLPSASRYSTLAGQITDLVAVNNLTDKASVIKDQFINHKKIINDLYVAYPKNTDDWEWKYIKDDYNYLGLYLDKLEQVK